MNDREPAEWLQGVSMFLAIISMIAVSIWNVWTTWVILAGGTVPLFGMEVGPNAFGAFLWFMFGEPVAMTLVYWAWMLIFIPLGLVFRSR